MDICNLTSASIPYVLPPLRLDSGLEGYQVFCLKDQVENCAGLLRSCLHNPCHKHVVLKSVGIALRVFVELIQDVSPFAIHILPLFHRLRHHLHRTESVIRSGSSKSTNQVITQTHNKIINEWQLIFRSIHCVSTCSA